MQQTQRSTRVSALDGLRVLCIVAILIYHLNLNILPSGHMGVVMFLVMSGYLATNALVRRFDKEGHVGFGYLLRSWGHRVMRILPSVAALVAITAIVCGLVNHVMLTKMRPDVGPSLGFFLNWSYVLRDVSYFDLIGGSSPLLHLWYLGCDMQFFLAWTFVLYFLLKGGKRPARWVAFFGAVASAAWMAWLFVPGGDPSRIYYGTDTRAFSLLLGSWLALLFPLGGRPEVWGRLWVKDLDPEKHGPGKTRATVWAHLLGMLSLAGLVAAMVLIPADSELWYRGGMFAFSLLTMVLVATLLAPTTVVGFLLGLPPLRVLGKRSFALYLWHYPIFLLMGADKSTTVWWMRLAAIGISLVAAELSLRLVERPFGTRNTTTEEDSPAAYKRLMALRAVSILAVGTCCIYAAHVLDITPEAFLVPPESLVSTGASADTAMDLSQGRPQAQAQHTGDVGGGAQTDAGPASDEAQGAAGTQAGGTQSGGAQAGGSQAGGSQDATNTQAGGTQAEASAQAKAPVEVTDLTVVHAPQDELAKGLYDPVLIGDSVPGDAGNEFVANEGGWEGRLPDSLIDTFIGRNPYQALEVLKGYLEQNVVGKVVVLACFSNSTPMPETIDAMVEAAGPEREVYLVGTVNPDGFQDAANANLQAAAEAHENVHYVDWPAVLDGHMPEYLWADDTHLRPEGARVYVDMIVRAVAQTLVDAGGTATER